MLETFSSSSVLMCFGSAGQERGVSVDRYRFLNHPYVVRIRWQSSTLTKLSDVMNSDPYTS